MHSTRGSVSAAHQAQAEVCTVMTTKVNSDLLDRETLHAAQSEHTAFLRYQKEKYHERKEEKARHHRASIDALSALAIAKEKIDLLRSIAGDECMPEKVRIDARKKTVKLMEDL